MMRGDAVGFFLFIVVRETQFAFFWHGCLVREKSKMKIGNKVDDISGFSWLFGDFVSSICPTKTWILLGFMAQRLWVGCLGGPPWSGSILRKEVQRGSESCPMEIQLMVQKSHSQPPFGCMKSCR